MRLMEICQDLFGWNRSQFEAFKDICTLMGCGEILLPLCTKEYDNALDGLSELNPLLQDYLFRAGKNNPLGSAKERFEIEGKMTDLHHQLTELVLHLGAHRAQLPNEWMTVNAIFILGSTVPNMAKRIEFCRDQILPAVSNVAPRIFGLSGERALIPVKADPTRGYLGDISDAPREGYTFLNTQELAPTLGQYHKEGKPTESGAMSLLLSNLLPGKTTEVIDAKAKPGKDRPDTEDTAYYAGVQLLESRSSFNDFKLVIVSDAAFPGQREQVICGLRRAGIELAKHQIEFYGSGYSDALVSSSAAYLQILISSVAERTYNTMKRLESEPIRAVTSTSESVFLSASRSSSSSLESTYPEDRGWSRE